MKRIQQIDGKTIFMSTLPKTDATLLRLAIDAGIDLSYCNFAGMTLENADLRGGVFCGALFGNANLTGADLRGADLCRADIRGANLIGSRIDGTTRVQAVVFNGGELTGIRLGS